MQTYDLKKDTDNWFKQQLGLHDKEPLQLRIKELSISHTENDKPSSPLIPKNITISKSTFSLNDPRSSWNDRQLSSRWVPTTVHCKKCNGGDCRDNNNCEGDWEGCLFR